MHLILSKNLTQMAIKCCGRFIYMFIYLTLSLKFQVVILRNPNLKNGIQKTITLREQDRHVLHRRSIYKSLTKMNLLAALYQV